VFRCVRFLPLLVPSLSASTFSFDDWDTLLPLPSTVGSSSLTTPSASVLSSSSTPTGEFQPFTAVGMAVAGGGGRKAVSLFFGGHVASVCAGTIGKSKFCIKASMQDATNLLGDICVVQAHGTHKFPVDTNSFYVKETDAKAYMKPVFDAPVLTDDAIAAILQQSLSIKEWEVFFADLSQGAVPDWLAPHWTTGPECMATAPSTLTSPRLSVSAVGPLNFVPTLSFDDESVAPIDGENAAWIKEFQRRFTSLKSKWGQAFTDIEANHLLVVKDLQVLHSSATTLASQIGTLQLSDHLNQGSTVWSALSKFARTFAEHSTALMTSTESTQEMRQRVTELSETQETLQTEVSQRFQTLERLSYVFDSRFNKILPIILSLKGQVPIDTSGRDADLETLRTQVQHLSGGGGGSNRRQSVSVV